MQCYDFFLILLFLWHIFLLQFQWKKGKLSCPKCHGRLGSFDFVTPYKLQDSSKKVSHIHVMRSRVDCESSSPVVARIRPMPQNSRDVSQSNDPDETASSAQIETSVGGAESLPHPSDNESAITVTSASLLPLLTDQTSRQFLPETFSSASDEEILSNLPVSANYQRAVSVSQPLEQQIHHVTCRTTSSSAEQPRQPSSSNCRIGRPTAGSLQNIFSLQSGDLDGVRHRVNRGTVPVDKYVPFGIDGGHARNDSDAMMKNSPKERSVAYVAGTNRLNNRVALNHLTASQPSTSSDNFSPYRNQNQRHNQQEQTWQYDNHSDELDDDDSHDERVQYCPSQSSSSGSSSSTIVSNSRSLDISANIFKNSPAFLRPLITSTFSSDRTRTPTPSPPSLYSPVLQSLEQPDRTTPAQREMSLAAQGTSGRDSDDEDDILVAPLSGARQRSPREQRRERNRKKKERRKQRRYERWLERQTFGAEEESAIQVKTNACPSK